MFFLKYETIVERICLKPGVDGTVSNPFKDDVEAKRYGQYRPRYHDIPMQLIRNYIGDTLENALDVACGTGHSTQALSKIVKRVSGCDSSESMLSEAREKFDFEFVCAAAENLPFAQASFDLVNISMGFHWVEQEKFLNEAKRILKTDGFLIIDNYGFKGIVSSDPRKQGMHTQLMQDHLPPATEKDRYPTKQLAQQAGWNLATEFNYEHQVSFDAAAFSNFIMTWSHFQTLKSEDKKIVAERIEQTYRDIFEEKMLELEFGGRAQIYRPSD